MIVANIIAFLLYGGKKAIHSPQRLHQLIPGKLLSCCML